MTNPSVASVRTGLAPPTNPPAPAQSVPRSLRRLLARGARARLLDSSASGARFELHAPAGAALLVSPLLLVVALLPSLGDGHGAMNGVSVSFGAAALTLAWWGRSRHLTMALDYERRRLVIGHQDVELGEHCVWTLRCAPPGVHFPHGGFEACLDVASGDRWVLLRDSDPARVMRSLQRVESAAGTAAEAWGLPPSVAPWCFDARRNSSAEPPDQPPSAAPSSENPGTPLVQTRLATRGMRLLIAALATFVTLNLLLLVTSQSQRLPHVHPLSLILPLLAAAFLVALALGLWLRYDRLSLRGNLCRSRGSLGRPRQLDQLAPAQVRGVYPVGAAESLRPHLLVVSDEGTLSMPVEARQVGVALRNVRQALGLDDPASEPGGAPIIRE